MHLKLFKRSQSQEKAYKAHKHYGVMNKYRHYHVT